MTFVTFVTFLFLRFGFFFEFSSNFFFGCIVENKKKMLVHLRWKMAEHPAYPFHYEVSESTTVGEVCSMVMETNNVWPGNPLFSVVRVCDSANDALVDDARAIGELRTDAGLCYLEFVAG